jgi:hypothetical protein
MPSASRFWRTAFHERPVRLTTSASGSTPRSVTSAGAHRGGGGRARELTFGVHVRNDNRDGTPPLVRLKAVCGPGDQGEPVITVMLPDET